MPSDATNMPHPRNAPYRSSESASIASDKLDTTLKLENMLLEEYNYAKLTAYQAMEDRTRIFKLYLLLIGILASGLGAVYQFNSCPARECLFCRSCVRRCKQRPLSFH